MSETEVATTTASLEEAAAMDFEPWLHTAGEQWPPSASEWEKLANWHPVTFRVAWTLLHKTKPQVMDFLDKLDEEAGDELTNSFFAAIDFAKMMLTMLETAEARILIAGAALETQDQAN